MTTVLTQVQENMTTMFKYRKHDCCTQEKMTTVVRYRTHDCSTQVQKNMTVVLRYKKTNMTAVLRYKTTCLLYSGTGKHDCC